MNAKWTLQNHRDHAWEYFKVHAQQRMSLFNFFVVFSSLATTCMVGTFREKTESHVVGIGLGLLLMSISIIFWKLDKRVRFLVKHAENALKWIESKYDLEECHDIPHVVRLFTDEEVLTTDEQPLTYAKCFGWTFLVFALVGLVGVILSVICLGNP